MSAHGTAQHGLPRTTARVLSATVLLAVVILAGHQFLSPGSVRSVPLQPVALLPPPPPPPETARPIEEPQELTPLQPQMGEWTEPGPAESSAPVSDNTLGLDEAEAGGGGDAFGLVAKPGGRELLLTAGAGGGVDRPGARYQQFAAALQSYLKTELERFPEIRRSCYTINLRLRVSAAGSMEDLTVLRSTGSPALDAQITAAFADLPPMAVTPPPDMPWPIALRVTSRRSDCRP